MKRIADGLVAFFFGLLAMGLYVSVHLARHNFEPAWVPFAGFVLGLTGSVALLGFRSLLKYALPKHVSGAVASADNVSELRRIA